jgi:antitoxin MazE
MRVAKWGNSLAVRLPKRVVDQLGLKAGDNIELIARGKGRADVKKDDSRERALDRMRRRKWPVPEGYRFDRDEANER